MGIVEFLEARIAEDELDALLVHELDCDLVVEAQRDPNFGWECTCHRPARVLADCKAKRAVIALANDWRGDANDYGQLDGALELLAAPYADHPDFDAAWA